ncbi:hypothetical protein NUM3379_15270 [Kineococcus sp. NUM-3379]
MSASPRGAGRAAPEPPRQVRVTVSSCAANRPDAAGQVEGLNCGRMFTGCPPGQWRGTTFTADAVPAPDRQWDSGASRCIGAPPPAPGAQPVQLPVLTAHDLRRLPLPAGNPAVQPGTGRVVVNLPVNVYVPAAPVTVNTTVLGFPVRVRATPALFRWEFGDGGTLGPTRDPGAPYPDLRTTHTYTRPGRYAIALTTTYTGEYSVAGGEWLPISGTADVTSAPVPVTALAGTNVLVP